MHDQHEMHLVATHSSGAEEWACPSCGRRFLINWPPAYSKTILEPGDEYALHSGSKGEMMNMGTMNVTDAEPTASIDDLFLPSALAARASLDGSSNLPIGSSFEAAEDRTTQITDELRPWLNWLDSTDL